MQAPSQNYIGEQLENQARSSRSDFPRDTFRLSAGDVTREETTTENEMVGRLREISFFADMSDNDLRQIAGITNVRQYAKDIIIIEEMSEAERFFIIQRGKIEISKRFEGAENFALSVQSDGDFFGEMALLDEGRRSATVRTLEPTTVLEISRADFETLLTKAPVLAYRIMKELSARLRESGALLISHLKQRNRQLLQAYIETITIIVRTLEGPAGGTAGVVELALALGRELGWRDEDMLVLEICALIDQLETLSSSERPALERIIPHMLRQQGGFEGYPRLDSLEKGIMVRAQRLATLARAFQELAPLGASATKAALKVLRAEVPVRYDAEALEMLVRITERPDWSPGASLPAS